MYTYLRLFNTACLHDWHRCFPIPHFPLREAVSRGELYLQPGYHSGSIRHEHPKVPDTSGLCCLHPGPMFGAGSCPSLIPGTSCVPWGHPRSPIALRMWGRCGAGRRRRSRDPEWVLEPSGKCCGVLGRHRAGKAVGTCRGWLRSTASPPTRDSWHLACPGWRWDEMMGQAGREATNTPQLNEGFGKLRLSPQPRHRLPRWSWAGSLISLLLSLTFVKSGQHRRWSSLCLRRFGGPEAVGVVCGPCSGLEEVRKKERCLVERPGAGCSLWWSFLLFLP